MADIISWTPYCGPAPAPADLLSRWNLDPVVITALAAMGVAATLVRPGARRGLVYLGVAALAVAFVSPLCALSSALFSARVAHHALIVAVAAPLLAYAAPAARLPRLPLVPATFAHVAALWTWHAPGPYAWALGHDAAYWLMEGSLLATALAFWSAVRRADGLSGAAAILGVMAPMGLLGALIAFAAQPLYAPHATGPLAWGLSPLADQQLAGVLMWAPLAGVYLLAGLWQARRALAPTASA